jgi:hypothetical protein
MNNFIKRLTVLCYTARNAVLHGNFFMVRQLRTAAHCSQLQLASSVARHVVVYLE